jgi:S1-C subfamily serine protease
VKTVPAQEPEVGEEIMTIGNPEGLEASMSTGVVSGVRREGKIHLYQITALCLREVAAVQ